MSAARGPGALFDELRAKDPQAASRMDPHNPRRTIRALEVIEVTGRPYSASLPRYRYVIASVQIGLDLPREELDQRIDIRTKQMLEGGFIEEVERIRPHLGATAGRALGYQQVIDYLDGLCDLDDTFRDIAQKTKRLARKQMGWFGRDPRIHWLHALNPRLVDNAMAVIDHADAGDYDPIDAQATSIRNIIWATCSNGRAARGDRYPVVTGNRVAAASVSERAPAPSRRSGRPAWGSRGARCRRTSG